MTMQTRAHQRCRDPAHHLRSGHAVVFGALGAVVIQYAALAVVRLQTFAALGGDTVWDNPGGGDIVLHLQEFRRDWELAI
jgi:hypothetical protein